MIRTLTSLFLVVTAVFFILKQAPGSPFANEFGIGKIAKANLERNFGEDLPLLEQWITFLKKALQGDLGSSLIFQERDVLSLFLNALPTTLLLTALTLFLSLAFGIPLGLLLKKQTKISILFLSLPSFFIAALIQEFTAAIGNEALFFAAFALAIAPSVTIARLTSTRLKSVMKEPFILAAKLKGLSKSRILLAHALPSALTPSVSYITQLGAHLIMGSVAMEKVFAMPGIGLLTLSAVQNRDYPVVLGAALFYTLTLSLFITLSDFIYARIDPRVRNAFREETHLFNPY